MCSAKKIYKAKIYKAKKQISYHRAAYVAELLDNKDVKFWKKWRYLRAKCEDPVNGEEEKKLVNNVKDNFSEKYINFSETVKLVDKFLCK